MAKFNTRSTRPQVRSAVQTASTATAHTFEGSPGFARDVKSELFLLGVSEFAGESTFYEGETQRADRLNGLVSEAARRDPEWTLSFLGWLRQEANLRTVAISAAVFAVKARLDAGLEGFSRKFVDAVIQRADEPGEFLAAWTSRFGRALPQPVKRGVADAVKRLYSQRSLLKYDSDKAGYRFADVLDLTHPSPDLEKPWQGDLFKHALDRRHGQDETVPESLTLLRNRAVLMGTPVDQRKDILTIEGGSQKLADAGMTWESLAGWLQGPMDAAAWEAIIPSMGYMALLRNLRNFDEAGVSDRVAKTVADKLSDPDEVAKSRQLPMRFLSAFRHAPSLRWSWALEQALDHSLANVPELSGNTLILVDTSSSMRDVFSKDGSLKRWDAAAIFGLALARRAENPEVVSYSSAQLYYGDPAGVKAKPYTLRKGESLLSMVKRWETDGYFLGGGTATKLTVDKYFRSGTHNRIVLLTDEQAGYHASGDVFQIVPPTVATYTWNLAGYQHGHAPSGLNNRHTFGGLTDASFRMIPLIEAGRDGTWPWEK